MLGTNGPAAILIQVLEERGIALKAFDLHAGGGPASGVELVDEGKILRALEAQLVDPTVISEDNGLHNAHSTLECPGGGGAMRILAAMDGESPEGSPMVRTVRSNYDACSERNVTSEDQFVEHGGFRRPWLRSLHPVSTRFKFESSLYFSNRQIRQKPSVGIDSVSNIDPNPVFSYHFGDTH